MNGLKPSIILLVEDDPGDQKLMKLSFEQQRIANELHIVSSGEEALDFLSRRGAYSDKTCPDLILLDLNMPGMGGKEFLKKIKATDEFRDIPVVIITASDLEQDILDSYKLQASGYVKKPIDISEVKEVMKGIGEYWFVICKLPPRRK